MKEYLTIGQVSKLLDIPEPTLRFWQEKGIFSIPKDVNHYRKYSIADLVYIAEIAFYRNMGMPVRQMGNFSSLDLDDYIKILGSMEPALREKISLYTDMYHSVLMKRKHIQTIQTLKEAEYLYDAVPFDRLVKFDYSDRNNLIRYAQNPSLYVRYLDTRDESVEIRGIISESPAESDHLLWQKSEDIEYAVFLVEEIASEDYRNNITQKLTALQKKHRTGVLFAQFLLSASENNRRIDYLKAYVQLLD